MVAHLGIRIEDSTPRSGQRELTETLGRVGIKQKPLSTFDETDCSVLRRRLRAGWPAVVRNVPDIAFVDLDLEYLKDNPITIYSVQDFTEISHWIDQWRDSLT